VRWACLSNVLTLMTVSPKVATRFPSYDHLVSARLLTKTEMKKLNNLKETTDGNHAIVFRPVQWAQTAIRKAFEEGLLHIRHEVELIRECNKISGCNGMLLVYGWIPIPLAYTQVVTIACYSYFLAGLFGNQFLNPTLYVDDGTGLKPLDPTNATQNTVEMRYGAVNLVGYDNTILDFYFPLFSVLEFIFYDGWLRVAAALLSPFGEDDDDFDVNYIIDRNILISFIMVDQDDLEMEPDPFGEDQLPPMELPHTARSVRDGIFKKKKYYNPPITAQPASKGWHFGRIFGANNHGNRMHDVPTVETIAPQDFPYVDDNYAEQLHLTEDGAQHNSARKSK